MLRRLMLIFIAYADGAPRRLMPYAGRLTIASAADAAAAALSSPPCFDDAADRCRQPYDVASVKLMPLMLRDVADDICLRYFAALRAYAAAC